MGGARGRRRGAGCQEAVVRSTVRGTRRQPWAKGHMNRAARLGLAPRPSVRACVCVCTTTCHTHAETVVSASGSGGSQCEDAHPGTRVPCPWLATAGCMPGASDGATGRRVHARVHRTCASAWVLRRTCRGGARAPRAPRRRWATPKASLGRTAAAACLAAAPPGPGRETPGAGAGRSAAGGPPRHLPKRWRIAATGGAESDVSTHERQAGTCALRAASHKARSRP